MTYINEKEIEHYDVNWGFMAHQQECYGTKHYL
jgi:hypothetical protein